MTQLGRSKYIHEFGFYKSAAISKKLQYVNYEPIMISACCLVMITDVKQLKVPRTYFPNITIANSDKLLKNKSASIIKEKACDER